MRDLPWTMASCYTTAHLPGEPTSCPDLGPPSRATRREPRVHGQEA
ncbi:MAG TPA: hypothetical protein PK668_04840 [Myxococcota bacterium]|nr:hypothetical protein [Myxococcota bacterium]HRY92188.1 hypothetical protein [Myxococcota bacterium]